MWKWKEGGYDGGANLKGKDGSNLKGTRTKRSIHHRRIHHRRKGMSKSMRKGMSKSVKSSMKSVGWDGEISDDENRDDGGTSDGGFVGGSPSVPLRRTVKNTRRSLLEKILLGNQIHNAALQAGDEEFSYDSYEEDSEAADRLIDGERRDREQGYEDQRADESDESASSSRKSASRSSKSASHVKKRLRTEGRGRQPATTTPHETNYGNPTTEKEVSLQSHQSQLQHDSSSSDSSSNSSSNSASNTSSSHGPEPSAAASSLTNTNRISNIHGDHPPLRRYFCEDATRLAFSEQFRTLWEDASIAEPAKEVVVMRRMRGCLDEVLKRRRAMENEENNSFNDDFSGRFHAGRNSTWYESSGYNASNIYASGVHSHINPECEILLKVYRRLKRIGKEEEIGKEEDAKRGEDQIKRGPGGMKSREKDSNQRTHSEKKKKRAEKKSLRKKSLLTHLSAMLNNQDSYLARQMRRTKLVGQESPLADEYSLSDNYHVDIEKELERVPSNGLPILLHNALPPKECSETMGARYECEFEDNFVHVGQWI